MVSSAALPIPADFHDAVAELKSIGVLVRQFPSEYRLYAGDGAISWSVAATDPIDIRIKGYALAQRYRDALAWRRFWCSHNNSCAA